MKTEEKLLVAMGEPMAPGDVPTVIIGVSDAAEKYMRGTELSHNIDLRKLGIPAKVMIFAGADHAAMVATLQKAGEASGTPLQDRRKPGQPDLGIDCPTIN